MFYCFFKWQFLGCVVLWDQIFVEKSAKNSKNFRKFSQKNNVLRFKMVLNGRILMNFDKIAHKTPHRLFLETFQNFENFWEFDPQNPPKFTFYCSFKWQFSEKSRKFSKTAPSAPFSGASRPKILAECVVLWVKKSRFCVVGTPPWVGPPKNISDVWVSGNKNLAYWQHSCGHFLYPADSF